MEENFSYPLLQGIDIPEDLRKLPSGQLPEVCKELRRKIIDELSCNPGHFGSSLGVIELTVALHFVLTASLTVFVLSPLPMKVNTILLPAGMLQIPFLQLLVWQLQPKSMERTNVM